MQSKIQLLIIVGVAISFFVLVSIYIPPDEFFPAGILGLGFPLAVIFNVLAFIYFLRFRSFWLLFPFCMLLIGFPSVRNSFSFIERKVNRTDIVSLFSYNVNAVRYFEDSLNFDLNKSAFEHWVLGKGYDVVCLQEMLEVSGNSFELQGYLKASSVKNTLEGHNLGLFIFSKFPIIRQGELEFAFNSYNRLMWVDILVGSDTVRVMNVHLMSYDFSNDIQENLNKVRSGVMARSWHAKLMHQFILQTPYPVVLCGDFNETPWSYPYRKVSEQLVDSFSYSGNLYSYTYQFYLLPFRIDYIFLSPELIHGNYEVIQDAEWSDHWPVSIHIALQDQGG